MDRPEISTKRLAISKANGQMVIIVAITSFITVFCLIASKSLLSQNSYQARVTTSKTLAHTQLLSNLKAYDTLSSSYKKFVSENTNIIGGQNNGSGQNDGNNAKIILDALPSTYDFPALTSSIEDILNSANVKVTSIGGTDQQVSQGTNSASPSPQPVNIPFSFSISNGTYASIQQLISKLQNSIRPIQIDNIDMSGGSSNMTLTVNAHTFYQPSKNLSITSKVVK